jgi:uncharacterized membrane protein
MATIAIPSMRNHPYAPDTYERVLSVGAIVLLGFVIAAVVRGANEWHMIKTIVWVHLLSISLAVVLTPVMLLRPRGTASHRALGRVWASAMLATALISFGVRGINQGSFSFIHILSVWTAIQVPIIVWSARTHRIKRHRSAVRGMVTGALLIAGFFTFPFDRLLGHWLFG